VRLIVANTAECTQIFQGATFHVEHVLPTSKAGPTELANLAWACPGCNLQKSNRVDAIDPLDGQHVPLFDPRKDVWSAHFRWDGYQVDGITAVGRATSAMLRLNDPRRLLIRQAEELFGLVPP
jgi:HNH endonuclease